MTAPAIQHYLKLADESHEVANELIDMGHPRFSAAQSYYTIFYLAQALLLTKGLINSSHSAVVAAYGKELYVLNYNRTQGADSLWRLPAC